MFKLDEPCGKLRPSPPIGDAPPYTPDQGTLAPSMPKVSTEPSPHGVFLTGDAKICNFVTIVADGGLQSGMSDHSISFKCSI